MSARPETLPWRVEHRPPFTNPYVYGSSGVVAMCYEELDAEYVTRAVNAYDDLLAALEEIHEEASIHAGGMDWGDDPPSLVFARALESIETAAREVIRRARGEASV